MAAVARYDSTIWSDGTSVTSGDTATYMVHLANNHGWVQQSIAAPSRDEDDPLAWLDRRIDEIRMAL